MKKVAEAFQMKVKNKLQSVERSRGEKEMSTIATFHLQVAKTRRLSNKPKGLIGTKNTEII